MALEQEIIEQVVRIVLEELRGRQQAQDSGERAEGTDPFLREIGEAKRGTDVKEVVIALGPAYGTVIRRTIGGLDHRKVLQEIQAGIEEEGMRSRIVKVYKTSDVAFIGKAGAALSGSGFSIGLQSKGTALIHQRDLYPLTNIELYPQAPLIDISMYRDIGKNAARYAKGLNVTPLTTKNDPNIRARYQVKAALMHTRETELVDRRAPTMEIELMDTH
ncbi:propanediol/glycerol family dehydratase medium subunit [Bianquea renquensis]|jgi:glycerol dehydratase, medium subunit|uniref:Propanediol/glycerol family dehydratase medium subunit n=1 Tax=Bianquea renquensis TaxID=2763661 RepID=A0A926DRT6_9FIRM|nr:propanediol/glycerol family dehydratase medium subunit [Bianquea renquensis]MBC8542637.1 propanediol/glycerol family dehydratase medium subunit [Bianquea renquensis]